jgi:hypothetical protein
MSKKSKLISGLRKIREVEKKVLIGLNLSENQLAELSKGVTQLPNLVELDMNYELAKLPKKIAQLSNFALLLNSEKPNFEWNTEKNLQFEYHYESMSKGIIAMFIVRNRSFIEGNLYWKSGVVLNYEKTKALVISEPPDNKIKILIDGVKKQELLTIIRKEFAEIHKTFNNLPIKEMVQCICSKCAASDSCHKFDYKKLRDRLEKGIKEVECDISYEKVSIEELLNGVEDEATIQKGMEREYYSNSSVVHIHHGDEYNVNNHNNSKINVGRKVTVAAPKEKPIFFVEHPWISSLIVGVAGSLIASFILWDKIKSHIISWAQCFIDFIK